VLLALLLLVSDRARRQMELDERALGQPA
jgi:hypothetical protein